MKNIETLIADGGDITIGMIAGIECGVTAADGHSAVAMLVRREGETISALLRRLLEDFQARQVASRSKRAPKSSESWK